MHMAGHLVDARIVVPMARLVAHPARARAERPVKVRRGRVIDLPESASAGHCPPVR